MHYFFAIAKSVRCIVRKGKILRSSTFPIRYAATLMIESAWCNWEPLGRLLQADLPCHARQEKENSRRSLNFEPWWVLQIAVTGRPDVPAGIGASGSSSTAPRCPVGGPLSRPRHTRPTILPYRICLHMRARTYTDVHTHVRSMREGNIDLALHRQGGQRIPFKDHVSRTAVYRDYGPPEEVEGLEAFDSRVLSCGYVERIRGKSTTLH